MTHTLGPLVVGGPWPGISICYIVDEDHWEPIVELWSYKNGEAPEEIKELAQKFAAAPELLEALEMVEWTVHQGLLYCPWCSDIKPNHASDCPRQAALE
jgi:hypothetical protein